VIPPHVLAMADNDPTRARVIWIKLRLKQEFPMNVSEALYPWFVPGGTVLVPTDLPGKRYYYDRITQAFPQLANSSNWPNIPANYPNGGTQSQTAPPFTNSADKKWPLENTLCLTMALQVNRGSTVFNEDNFAINSLSPDIFIPQSPGGKLLQFSGPRSLVDSWGFPLFFYRWPVGNLDFYPTTFAGSTAPASSHVSAGARNATFPDPLDPQGTLMDRRWNNATNANARQFELYCHLIHSPYVPATYTAFTPYTEPTIVSAGPDNVLGISPQNALPFYPDDMRYDPLSSAPSFDNVSSYQLRTGGTGDK
jgi:hypothetical protein